MYGLIKVNAEIQWQMKQVLLENLFQETRIQNNRVIQLNKYA